GEVVAESVVAPELRVGEAADRAARARALRLDLRVRERRRDVNREALAEWEDDGERDGPLGPRLRAGAAPAPVAHALRPEGQCGGREERERNEFRTHRRLLTAS